MNKTLPEDTLSESAFNQLRAQAFLVNLENTLLKDGPDEEVEWFIDFVWKRIGGWVDCQ